MMLKHKDILHRLRLAGIAIDGPRLRVESRNGRILVHLDDDRIAWFPEEPGGLVAIKNERRILRLIEKYCRFRAPRIPSWPQPAAVANLPKVIEDSRLLARINRALERWKEGTPEVSDAVLIH